MGYLAIARKWRPSKFEDLVGQGHVVQTLRNAISMNRVSHAYLFSGARGIGKTSVARIFAKALRCPQSKEGMPCNECPECLAITESRSVDVVEIDGASNNGVEAVRGIRENVAYSASSGFYKIYIIDEVHMLSLSAFNALLKTLEEPPPHVIFVFATTEVQKIPLTILSRCQRFEFRRLSQSLIIERLKEILAAEGLSISEEGLTTIASNADGSLRDALSLLDQVLSYCGGETARGRILDEREIVAALGVHETSSVLKFWQAILADDSSAIVKLIGENYLAGIDLKHFAERCLEDLRLLYMAVLSQESKSPVSAEELDISAQRYASLSELAKGLSLVRVERMAQILTKAIAQLGWSSQPRFLLEMAAIRMSKLEGLAQIEAALLLPQAREAVPPPPPVVKASAVQPAQQQRKEEEPPPPPEPPPEISRPATESGPLSWKGFVDMVMKKRPLLGALLCHASFQMEGKKLVIAFVEGSFYERQAGDAKNRQDMDELIRIYFGKEMQWQLSSALAEAVHSIERHQQEEATALKKAALVHPAVTQTQKILGADVVDISVEN